MHRGNVLAVKTAPSRAVEPGDEQRIMRACLASGLE
jgi:hypothetical protein